METQPKWNISLKNNILLKKKRSKIEEENFEILSALFGDKGISQESPILTDFHCHKTMNKKFRCRGI